MSKPISQSKVDTSKCRELLPCPFCSSGDPDYYDLQLLKPNLVEEGLDLSKNYHIECPCGIKTAKWGRPIDAICQWNSRIKVDPSQIVSVETT